MTIDGEPVHRHYSLSATPNGRAYRVSIKRENDGRVSRYFHDQLANGGVVELLPPAGEMTLVPGDAPLMLISGGVGQTPLLPMAKQALGQGRRVVYLHAAQTPSIGPLPMNYVRLKKPIRRSSHWSPCLSKATPATIKGVLTRRCWPTIYPKALTATSLGPTA